MEEFTSMCVKTIVKTTVEGSQVTLECEKGNRITLSKHILECFGDDLRSIHFVKQD